MTLSSLVRPFLGGKGIPVLLAGLLFATATGPLHAQGKATGRYTSEAVIRVTEIANRAKFIKYGYNEGISILGGWVNQGDSLTFSTPLKAGVEYLFLAGGDADADDVDLEILDANGRVLASDVRVDPEAIVPFTPQVEGNYTLRMKLFKSRQGVPCVCVTTILKKNGWEVPVKNLDKASGRVMAALEVGDQTAQRQGQRLDLRRAPNQWAFFGGVLRQGESMGVKNLDLGFGDRVFVGAGDDFATVINLDLEDNNNRAVKRDGQNRAVSVLDTRANGERGGLRLHNRQGNGPAVVLMAIMDVYTPGR